MTMAEPRSGTDSDTWDVTIHKHARERMAEMRVHDAEVIDAVKHPELTAPDKEHPDRRIAVKGRLRVAYALEKNRNGDRFSDRPIVITVMWENGSAGRAAGPTTHVPNKVSNRAFYERLMIWGCTPGRRRGDTVQMRTPSGQLIDVYPPDGISKGNSTRTIIDGIKAVGASGAEEFWSRTEKVKPPRERVHATPSELAAVRPKIGDAAPVVTTPTTKEPSLESNLGRVLAYYRGHPSTVPSKDKVAEALGLPMRAVASSLWTLARDGHLEKVGAGQYRYRRWGESVAAKQRAQDDLRWVTDPANRPPPPKTRAPRRTRSEAAKQRRPPTVGLSDRMLDLFRARAGETVPLPVAAELLGCDLKAAQNAALGLHNTGRLQRLKRGEYVYAETNGDTPASRPKSKPNPVVRLHEIQRRLDAETDAEVAKMINGDDDEPVTYSVDSDDPIEQLRALAAEHRSSIAEPEPSGTVDAVQHEPTRPAQTGVSGASDTAPAVPPVYDTIDDEIDAVLELLVPRLRARHLRLAAEWTEVTRRLIDATRSDGAG